MWCFNRLRDVSQIINENINWQGSFSWPKYENYNLLNPLPDIAGVYLLTFKFKKGNILYLAGITNSTKKRFSTHTREFKKGNYNILDVKAAEKGERKEIWHGWKYAKEHRDEFIYNKETILHALELKLQSFRIFIAEIDDKRKRERIESGIMNNIYMSKNYWADLADRGMALKGRYNSEMPIEIKNFCKKKIYGLPELLEI